MPNSLMKIIITLLLTLCIFGQAKGKEIASNTLVNALKLEQPSTLVNAQTYGVLDGLSQSNITSLVEDNDGFVWIGTVNGLNRFDGQEFTHYFPSANGLASSFIRSLLISKSGKLLVGTDEGLAVYNKELDNFKRINIGEKAQKNPIWSIDEMNDHFIIGTETEVFITSSDFTHIKTFTGPFNGVKKIVSLNDDIFIRNYIGEVIKLSSPLQTYHTNTNDIIKTGNSLVALTNEGVFNLITGLKVSNGIYSSISKTESGFVALGGENLHSLSASFAELETGKIKIDKYNPNMSAIYRGSKATYISNQNSGLISVGDHSNIITTPKLTNESVWSINVTSSENLIIATSDKDIKVYDKDYRELSSYDSEVTGPKSAIELQNLIFVATDKGLFYIDVLTKEKTMISDESFFVINKDNDSNFIIAGTSKGDLLKYDIEKKSTQKIAIDPNNPIFDIKQYKDSFIIASQGGMFLLKGETVNPIYKEQFVVSLFVDQDKIIFGTNTSLLSYDFITTKIEQLYSNNKPIFSILVNGNYILGASTKEVVTIDKRTRNTVALTKDFGSLDEYNVHSIESINDKVFMGGISGLSTISTNSLDNYLSNSLPPKANLNDLLIFNVKENTAGTILNSQLFLTDKIKLKYSDYPFTLTFNSPGSALKNINYAYQMNGLSDVWIESKGINSATYTNLSPGEYQFTVYAIDPLTRKSGPHKTITIEITPPWWLAKEAKFIYFILALLISGAIVKAILRRREVQNQIVKSEERLKLSLWGSGDEMWDWDIETGQIYRSNIWGSLEFPRDGQRSGEHGEESNIHPMDQERVSSALNNHFYGKTDHFEAAYRVKGKSDEWVWILDRAKIVERDEKDNALRMTGTIKNINNFKHAEEQLRLFERAIANISEGMFILDSDFCFVEVNEACCELSMKHRDQFIGKQLNFDLYPDSYSEQIRSILHQQGSWSNDVESAKGDGSSFLMELTVDAIYDEQGHLSHYVGVFSDISRRKQQEEELRKLTNNDLLTNLPNRSSLMVTLGNLVKRDSHHTLMVLDLDNFKKINDSLGHQFGDELLIKVAKRIEDTVPYHTSIYRLGGDEFAILVDNNPDIGSSAVIANNVIDAFVTPFELSSDKVVVGMSIGIVLYPEDDQNEQALLRKADIAMYHAKSGGGNRYQFYSESLNRNAIRQLEVENLIREGLRDDLFEVYYQPKIDLKSGKMAGMEALIRLNHPEQGLIPPSEFIPLAEENGLIVEIGDLVMKKACFAAQKWRSQGIFDGRVAVNLSSYQFALPDLQQRIESILRLTQLPAANLELEITEGTVIKQPEKAIKVMQQLAKMGVSLALDDFGTGYSSLSYLKRFPIHTLKIDKAFVDDIDKSDRDLKMVDSIITIAHNMGLSVVGEGVEEASQLSILKALKCEEIQGFIFSKAVTESKFTELLRKEFIEPDSVQKNSEAI
ncbi:EAL domain-containing protein [uncultured Shewanella sp.]|uniref:EAL domain-containing protein n=1 Tax=uncultured Shewanella sp. TaxID=173975 RepID=UPI00261F1116|nr:EAL domain-containing protein [uncultured Shewanella sp.]